MGRAFDGRTEKGKENPLGHVPRRVKRLALLLAVGRSHRYRATMGDDISRGWIAIDEALVEIYGDIEPKHYGTILKWRAGGPDPLDGVSIYESTAFDIAHWHYVSYGLTELFLKESNDPDVSGWGFELTFRLRRDSDDEDAQPPIWPINMMQNLARYVFETGATLSPGDHMSANGPIAAEEDTKLTAFLFVEDPQLPARSTPNGKMEFVQIVGVTADEILAAQSWNTRGVLSLLAKRTPGWVSDLRRDSAIAHPAAQTIVRTGMDRDGSSMGVAFTEQLAFVQRADTIELCLGALGIEQLRKVVPGRLRFDRTLILVGTSASLELVSGPEVALVRPKDDEERTKLMLPPDVVTAFGERVLPKEGRYELSRELTVIVSKTEIRSSDGKTTKHTVG
jgi:suppressor of fused